MTIKAVIFDLDGTLVDFNLDYKAARAEVIRLLTKKGFSDSLFSINESIFDMLKKVEKRMRKNGEEEQEFMRLKKAVLSLVESYELEAAHETNIVPGITEALKTLRKMKLKIALFTVNGEKSTSYILRRFHLKRFLDAIITRESVLAVKPHPAHLKTALRALDVRSEEAVVVGDSARDMKCARKLKVLAVGVTTGISSIQELTQAGADYLASSSIDIPRLVQQLNRQSLK